MLDYRDPLFSVILFLSMIVVAILITNFLGNLKEKNRLKHLKEFVDKFDFLNDDEIKSIYSDNVSTNALLLLAIAFEKEGNYEKSLNIYLVLLENTSSKEKFTILQKMAEVYLKAGFLHKSRESLVEILRSFPRNKDVLKLLFIVDDKLKNYDEMDNVIEILEELDENVDKEKAYLEFKKAIFTNDKNKLKNLYKQYPILKRSYVSYFININPKMIFDEINEDEVYEMIDVFWNNENLPLKNDAFINIKGAKKEITTTLKSPIFELEVLKYTPKNLADLEFEYICSNCKHLFPLYDERCPHCGELFAMKVEVNIANKSIF